MSKVFCAPESLIPESIDNDTLYFSAYSDPKRNDIGNFGRTYREFFCKKSLFPSVLAWDFNTIALSVFSADRYVPRKSSEDGWTRTIDLTTCLCNPTAWNPVKEKLEKTFRFLTGDFWTFTFKGNGVEPPIANEPSLFGPSYDSVSLLSGGMDSLIGAIDIVDKGIKPVFVSQIVNGNQTEQAHFGKEICSESLHLLCNHNIEFDSIKAEPSTRGRSIVFFALAALVASTLHSETDSQVKIFVPENGLISLNIPLNIGRIGSFSTKTTHPVYMKGIQDIWDMLGMPYKLTMPYKYKTKAEMLIDYKEHDLLTKLVGMSVSCGKYKVHNRQHCGHCVPCMIRRAAFLKAGIIDNTVKGYKFEDLSKGRVLGGADDVGAMAIACINYRQKGIKRLISGNLSFTTPDDREDYEGVVKRGLEEVELLLKHHGVI